MSDLKLVPPPNRLFKLLSEVMVRDDVLMNFERIVHVLIKVQDVKGRLFCIGVGGGAANASHAVNDFRKLCAIEAYAPTDNVAELTARTNDVGWHSIFTDWLRTSRLAARDALFVFSVGGGHSNSSACILEAVEFALRTNANVIGVVGRGDGATARAQALGAKVIQVGALSEEVKDLLTPVTETLQIAVLHALVSDPRLKCGQTRW